MAEKVLFQTKLTDLATSDLEGLGTLRREGNKVYCWVKNASAYTALVAGGSSLVYNSTPATADDLFKRVYTPSTACTLTCSMSLPAGIPVTGIGVSGAASTGDHGWVLKEGTTQATVFNGLTAVGVGNILIATSAGGWVPTANALAPATYAANLAPTVGALLVVAASSIGPSTAQTCFVRVKCL